MILPCQMCGNQQIEHKKINNIDYKCTGCGNIRQKDLGVFRGWK